MVRSLGRIRSGIAFVSVLVAVVLFVGTGTVAAQDAPTEEFNETYGGGEFDGAESVVETSDGGFALGGITESFGAGNLDAWLIKTDSNGNVEFSKTYGGVDDDGALSVIETSDGGFAVAGGTSSFGTGDDGAWLIKTDSSGNEQFNETYGVKNGVATSVVETSDGGFALGGFTNSSGGGDEDAFLIKTDSDGNVKFDKIYGSGGLEEAAGSVVETSDGGYALVGEKGSFATGSKDAWLIKTDGNGNVEFDETYGGVEDDVAFSVLETSDGGFALGSDTESFGAGGDDAWLIKTDEDGNVEFDETYGGVDFDTARSVVETSDGGFALGGITESSGAGFADAWLIKTDADGNEQFNKTYGGTNDDSTLSVVETSDGGFTLAGSTESFSVGGRDVWLLNLSGSSGSETSPPLSIESPDRVLSSREFEFSVTMRESSVGEVSVESSDFGVELSVVDDAGDSIGAQTETSVEFIDIDEEKSTYTLEVNVTGGSEGGTGTITAATGGNIDDSDVDAQNSTAFTLVEVPPSPVEDVSDELWAAVTTDDGEDGLSLADLGNAIQEYQKNPSDPDVGGVSIDLSDLGSLIQHYRTEAV